MEVIIKPKLVQTAQTKNGFTIVELLIVIVVIGILAVIATVSYNGIQERAMHSSRVSAVKQTISLLEMYKVDHGTYPQPPLGTGSTNDRRSACLGTGWPEVGGVGVCWNIFDDNSIGGSTFVKSATLDTALAEYGTQPEWPQNPVWQGAYSSGKNMVLNGFVLRWLAVENTVDSFPAGFSLAWTIPASGKCGIPGAKASTLSHEGAQRCVIALE